MIARIYVLKHPETKVPLYVGSTKRTLPERLKEHLYDRVRSNSPIYDYLHDNKIKPEIELLEEVEVQNTKQLIKKEVEWFDKFAAQGFKLYNVNRDMKYSGSIKVDWAIYDAVKDLCHRERMSIGGFYDLAVRDRLKKFGVTVD